MGLQIWTKSIKATPSAKTRKQTGTPRDKESRRSREELPPTHLRPRAEAAERPARVIALVAGRPPVRPERVLGAARGRVYFLRTDFFCYMNSMSARKIKRI